MSGSITSRTIRSGLNAPTAASASAPVPADSTVKPWKFRAIAMTSTMFGSSSTTSTRWPLGVSLTPLSIDPLPGSRLRDSWEARKPSPQPVHGARLADDALQAVEVTADLLERPAAPEHLHVAAAAHALVLHEVDLAGVLDPCRPVARAAGLRPPPEAEVVLTGVRPPPVLAVEDRE